MTKIEWTDETWNPIRGCSHVSEGCRNCYAEVIAARFSKPPYWGSSLAEMRDGKPRWTGKIAFDDKALIRPLRWRKPRRVFVTSVGDPFHPNVTTEQRDALFAVMAMTPWHTYQLLTKRPQTMLAYIKGLPERRYDIAYWATLTRDPDEAYSHLVNTLVVEAILPNLWLGVSVEDQKTADDRLPHLLATPAAKHFISAEPLLGPLSLEVRVDWVICGGESGPNARPMHPDWPRSLRDQCTAAGVPFFFKQWGEWHPTIPAPRERLVCRCGWSGVWGDDIVTHSAICPKAASNDGVSPITIMGRPGKRRAGRELDGVIWDQVPEVET
jgi:protein gp37